MTGDRRIEMKILKKIGSFFAAMVPFFVFSAVQITAILLGGIVAFASEMMSSSSIPDTISTESVFAVGIVTNLICFFAAFAEMKIHRFSFRDISPVRQNGRVYITSVFFAVGAFFVFKLAESLVMKIAGVPVAAIPQEMTSSMIVLTYIAYLTDPFLEEFVFRGLMVKTFEKRFPAWVSAVVPTITFTLMYVNNSVCYFLLFGAALMFIRYKFGDLKLCVLVHLIVSVMSVTISLVKAEYYESIINIGGAVGVVIAAAAMFFMLKLSSKPVQTSENA